MAALALLAGSAAFSYVAWSNAPIGWSGKILEAGNVTAPNSAPTRNPVHGGDKPASIPSSTVQGTLAEMHLLTQDQVYLLREENRLLRERVYELRDALREPERTALP